MADVRIHDLPSAASWNGFFPQDKPGGPTECVSVATVEAKLVEDGFVKTATLVAGYQPLENQRLRTTDSPTFAGLLLSGATANKLARFNASKNLVAYDLVAADIPALDTAKITAGTFADAQIASAATWNAKLSPSAVSGVTGNIAIFSGANSVSDNTGLWFDGTGLWCDGYIHGGGFKVGGSNFVDASRNIINGGSGTFSGALWGYGLRSTGNVTIDTGYALVIDSVTRIGATGIGNLLKLQIAGVDRITNAGGFVGTSLQISGATANKLARFDASKNLVSYDLTLTIGATGKTIDGTANQSWSLAEIGAQAAGSYLPLAAGASFPLSGALHFGDAAGSYIKGGRNSAGDPYFYITSTNATTSGIRLMTSNSGTPVVGLSLEANGAISFGSLVAKPYPPDANYFSIWGDLANPPNYTLVGKRDGAETYLGAGTKVSLAIAGTEKLQVTSAGVAIPTLTGATTRIATINAAGQIGATDSPNVTKLQIAGVDRITNAGGFVGTSLQISGTSTLTGGIVGTTSGASAASGIVGEILSAYASGTSFTNTTAGVVLASLSLPAGSWLVWASGHVASAQNPTGVMSFFLSYSPTAGTAIDATTSFSAHTPSGSTGVTCLNSQIPINISSAVTIYLQGAQSGSGTPAINNGSTIFAQRIR